MDQNELELTFDESVAEVMQTLPPVLRTYIAEEKYAPVTQSLMSKYHLRIDQAGVLEQETMLMLMGIETPNEFTQALVEEAKLDQQTVNSIVQDVNTQIFIPLREQMRNEVGGGSQPVQSTTPPRPVVANAPVPNYAPPQPVAPPPVSMPRPSVAPTAPPAHAQNPFAQHNSSVAPLPPKFGVARPALTDAPVINTGKLLEDHEEPHIEFAPEPAPVTMPARTAPPPPNLPGAMPPVQAPLRATLEPAAVAPAATAPAQAPVSRAVAPTPPPAPAKPAYVSDPYREPIDESRA